MGAFSLGAHTTPIVTLFVLAIPLKTAPEACMLNSKTVQLKFVVILMHLCILQAAAKDCNGVVSRHLGWQKKWSPVCTTDLENIPNGLMLLVRARMLGRPAHPIGTGVEHLVSNIEAHCECKGGSKDMKRRIWGELSQSSAQFNVFGMFTQLLPRGTTPIEPPHLGSQFLHPAALAGIP